MSGEIIVVGMGPGPVKYLTGEARDALLAAKEVYFRLSDHPVYHWLRGRGKDCVSFDPLYALPGITYDKVYQTINHSLIKIAKTRGRAVYALPGNPAVFEKTPAWLRPQAQAAGIALRIIPGLSFLELLYLELEIDPEAGLQIINGFNFGYYGDYPFTEKLGLLIGQVGFPAVNQPSAGPSNAQAIKKALLKKFPAAHPVTLAWSTGMPDYELQTRTFKLAELSKQSGYVRSLASLYVPPIKPPWEWVKRPGKKGGAKKKRRAAKGARKPPGKKEPS